MSKYVKGCQTLSNVTVHPEMCIGSILKSGRCCQTVPGSSSCSRTWPNEVHSLRDLFLICLSQLQPTSACNVAEPRMRNTKTDSVAKKLAKMMICFLVWMPDNQKVSMFDCLVPTGKNHVASATHETVVLQCSRYLTATWHRGEWPGNVHTAREQFSPSLSREYH